MNKVKKIKCGNCSEEFNYYSSEFRPFCSERCKMIDLGLWFQESYTLVSNESLSDDDIEKVINESEKES